MIPSRVQNDKPTLFTNSKREELRLTFRDRLTDVAGWLLERLHCAAKIKEFEYVDPITNETIYLSTGTRYSVLHVGDKRYFFDRFTGRFDGTGLSLVEDGVATGPELSDQPNF